MKGHCTTSGNIYNFFFLVFPFHDEFYHQLTFPTIHCKILIARWCTLSNALGPVGTEQ